MTSSLGAYYIYALLDPSSLRVRYIGQTNNPIDRLLSHCKGIDSKRVNIWIKGLCAKGESPVMVILQKTTSRESAVLAEFDWMVLHRDKGADLLNVRVQRPHIYMQVQ